MKAFRIFVNGEQLCTAGVGPDGVLSAIVHWAGSTIEEGDFGFHVGGIDSRTDEHVVWQAPELKVGDEVSILIVETDEIDPEQKRYKRK